MIRYDRQCDSASLGSNRNNGDVEDDDHDRWCCFFRRRDDGRFASILLLISVSSSQKKSVSDTRLGGGCAPRVRCRLLGRCCRSSSSCSSSSTRCLPSYEKGRMDMSLRLIDDKKKKAMVRNVLCV